VGGFSRLGAKAKAPGLCQSTIGPSNSAPSREAGMLRLSYDVITNACKHASATTCGASLRQPVGWSSEWRTASPRPASKRRNSYRWRTLNAWPPQHDLYLAVTAVPLVHIGPGVITVVAITMLLWAAPRGVHSAPTRFRRTEQPENTRAISPPPPASPTSRNAEPGTSEHAGIRLATDTPPTVEAVAKGAASCSDAGR
jgi:hypothetical protein